MRLVSLLPLSVLLVLFCVVSGCDPSLSRDDDDSSASDDDDDQPGESFLDDEDPRGGCAASLTGRNGPPACGLLAALALGLWLGPRRRG